MTFESTLRAVAAAALSAAVGRRALARAALLGPPLQLRDELAAAALVL